MSSGRGIESVDPAVVRAEIDHPVRNRRRRGRRRRRVIAHRCAPQRLARRRVEGRERRRRGDEHAAVRDRRLDAASSDRRRPQLRAGRVVEGAQRGVPGVGCRDVQASVARSHGVAVSVRAGSAPRFDTGARVVHVNAVVAERHPEDPPVGNRRRRLHVRGHDPEARSSGRVEHVQLTTETPDEPTVGNDLAVGVAVSRVHRPDRGAGRGVERSGRWHRCGHLPPRRARPHQLRRAATCLGPTPRRAPAACSRTPRWSHPGCTRPRRQQPARNTRAAPIGASAARRCSCRSLSRRWPRPCGRVRRAGVSSHTPRDSYSRRTRPLRSRARAGIAGS